MLKVICVCGARPNFVKVAPICEALRDVPDAKVLLVHTGQHYSDRMSRLFFEQLRMPTPDVNLEVGSGPQGWQTAQIIERFEPVCQRFQPDWVLVVGDVNSTLAAALVAAKLDVKVAHVEAGLRSFDRTMPEEINRILTDAVSDQLFVSEPSGLENLRREGVEAGRCHLVGNVMIDTLVRHRERAAQSTILRPLGVHPRQYAVLTLHRPSNVDDGEALLAILDALESISNDMPVVCPLHPRTRGSIERLKLGPRIRSLRGLRLMEPLGYLDFLKLLDDAALVLTDSGGVQEETTYLGVPCLTLRENTERPITLTEGTNRLAGCRTDSILSAYHRLRVDPPVGRVPDLWDGQAAPRIVATLTGSSPASAAGKAMAAIP